MFRGELAGFGMSVGENGCGVSICRLKVSEEADMLC